MSPSSKHVQCVKFVVVVVKVVVVLVVEMLVEDVVLVNVAVVMVVMLVVVVLVVVVSSKQMNVEMPARGPQSCRWLQRGASNGSP
mmetsp:Transcript_12062/g.23418  ORF Transcript_12062/g.23418 Transcript_12062/m.23418 type:complete len:85 (-) Transcript_12062:139-393(-)